MPGPSSTHRPVCQEWLNYRACSRGNTCNKVHSEYSKVRTCDDWTATNRCWRGDRCKFAHINPEGKDARQLFSSSRHGRRLEPARSVSRPPEPRSAMSQPSASSRGVAVPPPPEPWGPPRPLGPPEPRRAPEPRGPRRRGGPDPCPHRFVSVGGCRDPDCKAGAHEDPGINERMPPLSMEFRSDMFDGSGDAGDTPGKHL